MAPERNEEAAASERGERLRGGRQSQRLIPQDSFAQDLRLRVGNILRYYAPRPDLDTQLVPILQFNYWTMKASQHMLKRAAAVIGPYSYEDAFEANLHGYFGDHLEEERGHDEWMRADLRENGYFEGECPLIAASLIGTVMYSIEFLDPAALLGWQIIGECFPLTEYELVMLECVWGKTLLRTARYHATHDRKHGADLLAVIDKLPPRRQAIVERTAMATARMFAAAMQEIANGAA